MAFREPHWWYEPDGGQWLPRTLAPLAAVYGHVSARRLEAAPMYRSRLPVVAVGNFTAGGTGKTPLVRHLVGVLRGMGHRPAILTRGFGGTLAGPHWVDADCDRAHATGDEPLLLARDAPVMVARDRALGARAIEADAGGRPTIIVMDDGLQNPRLAKDCTIAVVDAARGLGNGRCIPAGPLRAPLDAQIAITDAIVLNHGQGGGTLAGDAARLAEGFAGPVLVARVVAAPEPGFVAGRPVVAYAGIGVPARFFASLAAEGADIRHSIGFGDHHRFSEADAVRLLALARSIAGVLVTTEKDHVRLAGAVGPLAELRAASRVLPIHLAFDGPSAAALAALLAERVPARA